MKYLDHEALTKFLGVPDNFVNPYNFGHLDFLAIDALTRAVKPNKYSLEIGTCKGYGTAIIAKNAEHVTTVDVHPNRTYNVNPIQINEVPSIDEIGMYSFGFDNITQILTDSSNIPKVLHGMFDFIFIDGSHDLKHVTEDTDFALKHTIPKGIICWHDYSNVPDVTNYLDHLNIPYISELYHCGQWCVFARML